MKLWLIEEEASRCIARPQNSAAFRKKISVIGAPVIPVLLAQIPCYPQCRFCGQRKNTAPKSGIED